MSDELQRQALARSLAVRLQLLSLRDLQLVDEVVIRLCQRASESPRSRVAREAIDDLIAGVEASLDEQDAEREQGREAARVEMLGQASNLRACAEVADKCGLTGVAATWGAQADRIEHRGPVLTASSGPGGPYLLDPTRERVTVIGATSIMDADPATKARALDSMEQECRRLTIESASEFAPDQHLTLVSPDSAVIALGDERARDPDLEVDVELDSDPGPHTHIYQGTDRGDECMECGRLADQFADLADEWDRSDVGGRA